MKLGSYRLILSFFFLLFFNPVSFAEDKVSTSTLINLNELKPSFEEVEDLSNDTISNEVIKDKKKILIKSKSSSAKLIGLDKITAKTSEIVINLGETKKFGLLEIKGLKCGNVELESGQGQTAYIQVKDLSDNLNNQIFVFNGWTFSSSTTLNPIDHPVYDLWLVSCENV